MKRKHAKRHAKRHISKRIVKNPSKRHIRRHTVKHTHNRRKNPSRAMTLPKFDLENAGITLAITATGFVGNSIIKGTVSPLIPGYSSLTGMGIVLADSAVAVGVPFALAFLLPIIGMKKSTAIRVSTALGVGMLTNVIARVTSEVLSGQPVSSRIQRQIPGMGSIVNNIPGPKPYALGRKLSSNTTAKNVFNTIPSYVS